MNERLKELAEQVYGETWDENFKFAELIVLECVELLKKENEEYSLVGSVYCDNKAEAFDEAINLVKKHFGVKYNGK